MKRRDRSSGCYGTFERVVVIGVEISVLSMLSKYENMRARGLKNNLRKQFLFTLLFLFSLTLTSKYTYKTRHKGLIDVVDMKGKSRLKYNILKLKLHCFKKKIING